MYRIRPDMCRAMGCTEHDLELSTFSKVLKLSPNAKHPGQWHTFSRVDGISQWYVYSRVYRQCIRPFKLRGSDAQEQSFKRPA